MQKHILDPSLASSAKWFCKAGKTATRKVGPIEQAAQPIVLLCLELVLKVSQGVMLLV